MSSQRTFETRIGRYINGNAVIQPIAAYNPVNPLITKAANTAYINTVTGLNNTVTTSLGALGTLINTRQALVFPIGDTNPNCIERRIANAFNYLKTEVGLENGQVVFVGTVLNKIRPSGKGATGTKTFTLKAGESIVVNNVVNGSDATNTGNTNIEWNEVSGPNPPAPILPGETETITAPSGSVLFKNFSNLKAGKIKVTVNTSSAVTNSKSEKTFTAVLGFLSEIIVAIGAIGGGFVYSPVDPTLSIAQLTAVRNQLQTLNTNIVEAAGTYGTNHRLRKVAYDHSTTGMNMRIQLIKNYLAGFPDGKLNTFYIEYSDAIKGE